MEDSLPTAAEPQQPELLSPLPASLPWKFFYVIVVALLPIVCFFGVDVLQPEWQSGKFSDYVALALSPDAAMVFFPFIAYSALSFLLLFYSPSKRTKSFWVRLGIYSGTLVALQYSVMTVLAGNDAELIIVLTWILPLIALRIYQILIKRFAARIVNLAFITLLVLLYVVGVVSQLISHVGVYDLFFPFFFVIYAMAVSAPFWSLLIMGATSYNLLKAYESRLLLLNWAGILAWLAGFGLAWRYSVIKTLELYAALPPSPPDCYIATAAARGHPNLVRSWKVDLESGQPMRVNRQLQILKSAELILLTVSPRLHRLVRKVYDIVGENLARGIKNPYMADLAYLLLKPIEWAVVFMTGILLPEARDLVVRIYRK